ncbi:major facilitator superfamily domain-containing protein [Suillus subalutaceus]|uniref:major facilitator superfamily domain-containing protein n=1 Tax=Suillus subalutaceus TaxID=48586 RepID=UPI001B86C537|nr:major facilitator superfamily domain-containing protein [Suillus subalutaceus]KAG1854483.1 major facilitator superfamily domain-containing protein [Suillus subalutaceus]
MPAAGYIRLPETSPQDDNRSSHGDDASICETAVDNELRSVDAEQDAHAGVKKVEAAQRVYGRYSRWCLFVGIGLASYIYSLDASTTYAYLTFATSYFGEHSLISSITVVQSLIVAVGKPVIAKVADVSSRGTAYVGVCYIVIASAPNVTRIAGGIVLYAVGVQLLTQIIIADITTLAWRGLVVSLVSAPFLINAFIGSNISAAVIDSIGWRWGYGMFAILVPISLAPLIITLLWAERKAKMLALLDSPKPRSRNSSSQPSLPRGSMITRFLRSAEQLDLVGLILLGFAYAQNLGSIIAMLVMGIVLLVLFAVWDLRYASRPVIAPRFVRNRSVVCAALIGFFDFMSFFLTYAYLYSFVLVVKPWSLVNATYFIQVQSVGLTFFGILAGLSMRFLHRYKYVLVIGLVIRLIGVAMMIHSRGGNASDAELVWTQILQGFGGGFAAVSSQVGAQASVPHADVAIITAVVLLLTEIGGAAGNACANLEKYLPWLTDEKRAELFGSITLAASYPLGDPVREGVISAYDDTMKIMVTTATVLSVIPVLLALAMPNWYLGDRQNAIDAADLTGRSLLEDDSEDEEEL